MTQDQKKVLRALAVVVGFKAILYASIAYSARHYRKTIAQNSPG